MACRIIGSTPLSALMTRQVSSTLLDKHQWLTDPPKSPIDPNATCRCNIRCYWTVLCGLQAHRSFSTGPPKSNRLPLLSEFPETQSTALDLSHALESEGVNFLSAVSGPSPGDVRVSLRLLHAYCQMQTRDRRPAKVWGKAPIRSQSTKEWQKTLETWRSSTSTQ